MLISQLVSVTLRGISVHVYQASKQESILVSSNVSASETNIKLNVIINIICTVICTASIWGKSTWSFFFLSLSLLNYINDKAEWNPVVWCLWKDTWAEHQSIRCVLGTGQTVPSKRVKDWGKKKKNRARGGCSCRDPFIVAQWVDSQPCDHIPEHCLAQIQEQQSCSNIPPLLLLNLEKILYALLLPFSALMLSCPLRPNYDPPKKPVCSHKSLS